MPDFGRAAFRQTAVQVARNGFSALLPPLPADRWLAAMTRDDYPFSVMSLFPGEQRDQVLDQMQYGNADPDELLRFLRSAVTEAAGMPWWEAEALVVATLSNRGRLLGIVLGSGVRTDSVSLAVFCSCVWAALTRHADATELMKLESLLEVPPADAGDDELPDGEDFAAAARRLQGIPGVRSG